MIRHQDSTFPVTTIMTTENTTRLSKWRFAGDKTHPKDIAEYKTHLKAAAQTILETSTLVEVGSLLAIREEVSLQSYAKGAFLQHRKGDGRTTRLLFASNPRAREELMRTLESNGGAGELTKAVSVMYAHFLGENDFIGADTSSGRDPDDERRQLAETLATRLVVSIRRAALNSSSQPQS